MYEVEFRIPTATYAYVNLKITGETAGDIEVQLDQMQDWFPLKLGQTGAALIGAVNHGHANPNAGITKAELQELTDFDQEVDALKSDPMELIKSDLGGKVIAVEAAQAASQQKPDPVAQVAQEKPSEAPSRPWDRQPETVQQKPWDEKTVHHAVMKPKTGGLDDFFV